MGNVTVFSEEVIGSFPESKSGEDAILPCDIVPAGKFRNGKLRWWCRTHQVHWGVKADLIALEANQDNKIICSNAGQPMHYVIDPILLVPSEYPGGVGVWVSLPPAIESRNGANHGVRVHVHARKIPGEKKDIDEDYNAIQLALEGKDLFSGVSDRINVTPPAGWAFVIPFEKGLPLDCIDCNKCHAPHLDMGDFATTPHRKHFCANCGNDSNWSKRPIVSNPLKIIFDNLTKNKGFITPDRQINLDDFPGHKVEIWSSTPAIVWTCDRPQEKGIHVNIYDGEDNRIVDETFGEVIHEGGVLQRRCLLDTMIKKANKSLTCFGVNGELELMG